LGSEERLTRIPKEPDARRRYYENKWKPRYSRAAEQHRDLLIKWYGEEKGQAIEYAQVFQVCGFGRRPSRNERQRLFPFFPER